MSITHSECVFVSLSVQHAMRMPRVAICGIFGSSKKVNLDPGNDVTGHVTNPLIPGSRSMTFPPHT